MFRSDSFKKMAHHGEIKLAEPSDNPGELMVLTMPLLSNIQLGEKGWTQTVCPLCTTACWASPNLPLAAELFPDRVIVACTNCSISATLNKRELPRFLEDAGIHPNDVMNTVLSSIEKSNL